MGSSGQTGLVGSGPCPFPALVSGELGSGMHPPMLPSSSDFLGLDFIAVLSFQPTHQSPPSLSPAQLKYSCFPDLWGHRLGSWVSWGMRWVRDHSHLLRVNSEDCNGGDLLTPEAIIHQLLHSFAEERF